MLRSLSDNGIKNGNLTNISGEAYQHIAIIYIMNNADNSKNKPNLITENKYDVQSKVRIPSGDFTYPTRTRESDYSITKPVRLTHLV
jgi:hypothetical protein